MLYGIAGLGNQVDMATGQLTDQIVLDYQAQQAAAALAAQTPPKPNYTPYLIVAALAGGYWWYTKNKGAIKLPSLSMPSFKV